jgi:precorrin-6B methylase 2
LKEYCREIVELEIRRAAPVGPSLIMKPDNPVTLFVFEKKIEGSGN